MMTQGVVTQAMNLFGNTTGNVAAKNKQSGSGFEVIIDHSMKSEQHVTGGSDAATVKKAVQQSQTKDNSNSKDVVDRSSSQTTNEVSNNAADAKVNTDSKKELQTNDQDGSTQAVTAEKSEEPVVDEQTMENISGMLQSIRQMIMDVLNLKPEELDQLLKGQGLKIQDLLQPENLQQLILANSGQTDLLAVITDENLANVMNQLVQSVEEIKTNANLGMSMDQVKKILDQAMKVTKEVSEEPVDPQNTQTMVAAQTGVEQKQDSGNPAGKDDKTTEGNKNKVGTEHSAEAVKATDGKDASSQNQTDLTGDHKDNLETSEHFETFINHLANAATTTPVEFDQDMIKAAQIRDIATQIIDKIRISVRTNDTSMELQLNPEHLGKVNLTVQSKSGVMTAQFVVQNEISKEAIESQLHTLRETLNQQGIKVDAIEVTVASNPFEHNANEQAGGETQEKQNNHSKGISLEDAMNISEDTLEATDTVDTSEIRGSQIDYTA